MSLLLLFPGAPAAGGFQAAWAASSNVVSGVSVMQKNVAGQKIGAQLVSASDGSAFTGSVSVYVTVDAGTQALGSVGSGACTHEGEGYHTYAPSQAETNGTLIAFTFKGTGAVPVTVQVFTLGFDPTAAQIPANVTQISGDSVAADNLEAAADGTGYNLGGGSVVAASVTGAVGSVTGNVGGNVTGSIGSLATQAKADVNAEADTALSDYDPPTRTELTSDTNSILSKLLKYVQLMLRKDSAIATDNATEVTAINADGGSGAGAFANTTDSQEALRDRGDTAWTTATGFSTLDAAGVRSAVGLASANLDTQLAALPTAAENADAVWEEAIADHSGTAGSTAESLNAAGSAGDPWTTALPGSYTGSQAGKMLSDILTDTGTTLDGKLDTVDTVVDAIKAKADNLPASPAATGDIPSAATVADAVWDEATTGHTTSGTFGEQLKTDVDAILVDTAEIGAAGAGLTEAGGTGDQLTAVPWNASWDAEVQSEVADALDATIADSVPADGSRPSVNQALYMLTQFMLERSVSSTTVTVKKPDGSTSLFTLTLDDATTPTSITRAT